MKYLIKISFSFFLILMFANNILAAGYKIKVKIKNYNDSIMQLGYYFEDKQYILQTENVKNSTVVFKGKKDLPRGMYFVVLPKKSYFDFLISDSQKINFQSDTINIVENMKVSNSDENKLFFDYQKYVRTQQKKLENLNTKLEKNKENIDKSAEIQDKIEELEKEAKNHWKELKEKYPNSLFTKLLQAMNGSPKNGYSHKDFFNHIDFSEVGLLRSPVIHKSIRQILARNLNRKLSMNNFIKELDMIIEKSKANKEVFQYTATHILSFLVGFQRIGINRVFVHVSEKYFLSGQATWLDDKGLESLKERTKMMKSSLIGEIAADIELETFKGNLISLHQIQAKYTLVFFWSTGCGHCEEATKTLKKFYEREDVENIEIVSVYNKSSKKDWGKFNKDFKVPDWINCWDVENKSDYKSLFYVVSTPILYLLDKDKKILSMKAGDVPIKDLVNQLIEQKDKFKH